MTTAAQNNDANTPNTKEAMQKTAKMMGAFAGDAGRAIGNFLPKAASLQQLTTRKYTLPDKTVASQVLMYRQLLHTKCKPALKLSRDYQATAAQTAVMHMPWWEKGIEESKKMVISYDNLITRLWLQGGIHPFTSVYHKTGGEADLLDAKPAGAAEVDTLLSDEGLPPIPHDFWVHRLGFQQPDPVTDFRSGGILSLAMLVYMVESQPAVCQRFFSGDASVLPFGITCINVTDMIAKFLMLAKSTDRMDALLSQKPFWKMFSDPNAILAVQTLAMTLLADVVVELAQERQIPELAEQHSSQQGTSGEEARTEVTVFDFSIILERTEGRVRDDLLGAGPKTVVELKSVAGRLRLKYKSQLEKKIERVQQQKQQAESGAAAAAAVEGSGDGTVIGRTTTSPSKHLASSPQIKEVMDKTGAVLDKTGAAFGSMFSKVKSQTGATLAGLRTPNAAGTPAATTPTATIVDLPPPDEGIAAAPVSDTTSEGDWVGTDIQSASDAISNFSIGDDDDDDDML